jgi:hypothetical protein
MISLTALPQYYLDKYSREKVTEVTGASKIQLGIWISKDNAFPLTAVDKLLAFDPSPLGAVVPVGEPGPECPPAQTRATPPVGEKLMILVPLSGPPQPKMMDSLLRLYDRKEMGYERFAFNNLSVARNALAARFLRSNAKWAYWVDGDMLLPAGDPTWFKEAAELPQLADTFAGLHAIYRSLVHQKTIVSCHYVSRHSPATPQFGGGDARRNELRRGPQDLLIEAPWAGMGGMLTHRSVFEDIIKTQGDTIRMKPGGIGTRFSYDYAFFHPLDAETPGDDIPLCVRAAKAGHKTYVDLAIQAIHLGDRGYSFRDI